jgi:hypothetical protein
MLKFSATACPPLSRTTPLGLPVVPEVEDVQRVAGQQRHRRHGLGGGEQGFPVVLAAFAKLGAALRALLDHHVLRWVFRQFHCLLQQGPVRHHTLILDATAGTEQHLGPRIIDAHCQLGSGEAAEHDRVHGAQAGASQHCDHGLGDHRHIDDHPVALFHSEGVQHSGAEGDALLQLAVADAFLGSADGES